MSWWAQSVPLLLDDLAEAVKHAIVLSVGTGASLQLAGCLVSNCILFRKAHTRLVIHSGLDNVKRVPAMLLVKCLEHATDRSGLTSPESTGKIKLALAFKRAKLRGAYL
jgi:hypothetical protein